MRVTTFLTTAIAAAVSVSATPYGSPIWGTSLAVRFPFFKRLNGTRAILKRHDGINPFEGKTLLTNPEWTAKLDVTQDAFLARGDNENADKVRAIRQIGTFVWVSSIASLNKVDNAMAAARAHKQAMEEIQDTNANADAGPVVGLVLYNIPNRDCSAGERAGELQGADGLERYKTEYIASLVEKISAATDLSFAIVLEPDSLANLITNLNIDKCADAAALYEEGIVHAISKLQFDHVHLYLDAAHGGWLGANGNLQPAAETFSRVVSRAGNNTRIRGFSTNVANYNPYSARVRENYTESSSSWDEDHYIQSLAPHLVKAGLPPRFIVDQGRVALPGARAEWSDWCNVVPSGFGVIPGTPVNNSLVDSIVWVKAGGESDGECGIPGAPKAGEWFANYAEQLVKNADGSVKKLA